MNLKLAASTQIKLEGRDPYRKAYVAELPVG
jgi:hypothetical protein